VKTILLLDDEVSMVKLMSRVLVRRGYSVLESSNTEGAIERFRDVRGQIDLFIADVNLPSSTGIQVALLLRAELPSLKVILMSGYPRSDWRRQDATDLEGLGSASLIILQKPFTPQALLNCIQELNQVPFAAAGTASNA
jgi:two-component system cell cycle sensor histidine kinase/response regulator CckA